MKILLGYTDPAWIRSEHSLLARTFVDALKAAGTQIYLAIGSHDNIVTYSSQIEYLKLLQGEGVPIEAEITFRAGHHMLKNNRGRARLLDVFLALVTPGAPFPSITPGKVSYSQIDRNTGLPMPYVPADGRFPFTFEAPSRTYPGLNVTIVATGEPGTEFKAFLLKEGSTMPLVIQGKIESSWHSNIALTIGPDQVGIYRYFVYIRKPGQAWKRLDMMDTPSRDRSPMLTRVEPVLPNVSLGADVSLLLIQGMNEVGPSYGVNWGVVENSAAVQENPPAVPEINFSANGAGQGGSVISVPHGTRVTFQWSAAGPISSCSSSGSLGNFTKLPTSGVVTMEPFSGPKTYQQFLTCTGPAGTTSRAVTIQVSGLPAPSVSFSVSGAGQSGSSIVVPSGSSVTFQWICSGFSTSCASYGSLGTFNQIPLSGTYTTAPIPVPGFYQQSLSGIGPGGSSTRTVSVEVSA
jgi:hypothetical protein